MKRKGKSQRWSHTFRWIRGLPGFVRTAAFPCVQAGAIVGPHPRHPRYVLFRSSLDGRTHFRHAFAIYADEECKVSLMTAPDVIPWLDPASSGEWWVGSTGALERPVTVHESLHPSARKVPDGWRIVGQNEIAALISARRSTPGPNPESELDAIERLRAEARRAKRHADKVSLLENRVALWHRKQKLATTKLRSYTRKLSLAKRRAEGEL